MQSNTILSAIIGLIAFCLSYLFLGSRSEVQNPNYGPKNAQHPDYVGLTEKEGRTKAANEGMRFRVINRDGKDYPITLDYLTNRINVALNNGYIVAAYYG